MEIDDLLLEESVIAGVTAGSVVRYIAGFQNVQKLVLLPVCRYFRVDLQRGFIRVAKLVSLPNTLLNEFACLYSLIVFHAAVLLIKSPKEQHQGRQSLLAVNDLKLIVVVLKCDYRSQEVFVVAVKQVAIIFRERKKKQIVPQGLALFLALGVWPLVIWNEEIGFFLAKQRLYAFLVYSDF